MALLRILKLLGLIWLLACLAALIFQRDLLYFPTPESGQMESYRVEMELPGGTMSAWVMQPEAEEAVLYFGGNAEPVELTLASLAEMLPDHAVHCLAYRGYSGNGGEPTEDGLYADALAAFDQLQDRYRTVHLIGRSLGSGVATLVAAQREAGKLVLITPFDSIAAVAQTHYPLLPMQWLTYDRYDSLARADSIHEPTLLLVAGQDRIVPREHSLRLREAFRPGVCQEVLLEEADHNDIARFKAFFDAIRGFL